MINLDETAIHRCATKQRGYFCKNKFDAEGNILARNIHKALKRGTATHVAAITNVSAVQGVLPQIFLLNNRTFRKNDIPDNLPAGMMFWRDVSGWNTGTKMVCILEAIKERIDPFVESSQPIVLLDMAPAHLMPEVYAAAHRLNIWLLFIPAKMTYLLQPLDVACLSSYKCSLRKVFTENEDNNGCLQTQDWFAALTKLLRSFWRARSWKNAFGCVGLSGKTCDLSEEIRSLGLVHNTVKPLSFPKETDIEKFWPKKKKVPFKSLFWLPAKLHLEEID